MASVKDVERVADDLESLIGELRSEIKNGADFERLIQIADEISEHADQAATTFNSVNEALMSRIEELRGGQGGKRSSGSASSGSQARQKSHTGSSSSGGGS